MVFFRNHQLLVFCNSDLKMNSVDLVARMPVIPEVNDDQDNISRTATTLKENGLKIIHCLPYHNLGTDKYKRMAIRPSRVIDKCMPQKRLEQVCEMFRAEGVDAIVY